MNPQGSRAGLITAVVILSILFVTAAIFAFYFSAESTKQTASLKDVQSKMTRFASDEAQADPNIQALADAQSDPANAGKSAIQIAVDQKNKMATLIAGKAGAGQNTEADARNAIKTLASDKALMATGVTITANDGLLPVVNQLADGLKKLTAQNQDQDKQLASLNTKIKNETALRQKVQKDLGDKFAEKSTELETALAQLTEFRNQGTESVTKVQGEAERGLKAAQAELSKANQSVAEKDGQIAQLNDQIKKLQLKVPRPEKTKESIVRQADGKIIRVPGNDNVFIDVGTGIAPGMTFEVYDRFGGVPGLGADPDAGSSVELDPKTLPKGKASVEVVRVIGPQQSECRIIRLTQGQTLIEGDVVANVVYDRNTKLNFVVFGEFDLDRDEIPTPGDAEVLKDRVRTWGGKLMDQVNVDTDLVVLGFEPQVPPQEEGESPTDIAKREAAQNALNAYDQVRNRAIELNIPILNQNRFLYYTGYYEQSQR
jgi:hypothetical protein